MGSALSGPLGLLGPCWVGWWAVECEMSFCILFSLFEYTNMVYILDIPNFVIKNNKYLTEYL